MDVDELRKKMSLNVDKLGEFFVSRELHIEEVLDLCLTYAARICMQDGVKPERFTHLMNNFCLWYEEQSKKNAEVAQRLENAGR
jgi:hypothetical protein